MTLGRSWGVEAAQPRPRWGKRDSLQAEARALGNLFGRCENSSELQELAKLNFTSI